MDFYDLDLSDEILDALDDMRFSETTPIQEHAIPPILEGKDIVGVAQTGTGKTAAYLLPILSMLGSGGYPEGKCNCLIMSPTRELAQQIDQALQGFAYYLPTVSSVAVYGGNDAIRYEQEKRGFDTGASVIVATPGRLISHISLDNVDLSHVSFFVLDEADRMLDMGFHDDIMQIARQLPDSRQTIMFSATMPDKIEQLARQLLKDPVEVKIAVSRPADGIHQRAYLCNEVQKLAIVKAIFREKPPHRVIIFAGSKLKVKELNLTLLRSGLNASAMHSDLTQPERDEAMFRFKSGAIDVLVATDILSRGIDIDDVQMVLNFDVPRDPEDYVHRIGRTARAGAEGEAVTLVSSADRPLFKAIERFLGKEVEKPCLPEGVGPSPVSPSRKEGQADNNRRRRRGSRGGDRSRDYRHGQPQTASAGPSAAGSSASSGGKRRHHGRRKTPNRTSSPAQQKQ